MVVGRADRVILPPRKLRCLETCANLPTHCECFLVLPHALNASGCRQGSIQSSNILQPSAQQGDQRDLAVDHQDVDSRLLFLNACAVEQFPFTYARRMVVTTVAPYDHPILEVIFKKPAFQNGAWPILHIGLSLRNWSPFAVLLADLVV